VVERFPFHAHVSLSETTYAEVQQIARVDDRSESAVIRRLVGIGLTLLRQQWQSQPQLNGRQQPEEHRNGLGLP
jgi:hypothetical protein